MSALVMSPFRATQIEILLLICSLTHLSSLVVSIARQNMHISIQVRIQNFTTSTS